MVSRGHLRNLGVTYIDMLICTNYDEDHASGFPDLDRRNITVGCILGNPTVSAETIVNLKTEDGMGDGTRAIANALAARRQIAWAQIPPTIPGLGLTWSCNPYPYFDDENNLSLVVTLNIHGFKFMFPDDMETKGFKHLLNTYPPFRQIVAGVHVLVAPHHGRDNGICPEMFDAYGCSPQLVVISDDYKQYDTQETTNYYGGKARGIPWFRDQGARYVLTTRTRAEPLYRRALVIQEKALGPDHPGVATRRPRTTATDANFPCSPTTKAIRSDIMKARRLATAVSHRLTLE